MCLEQTAAIRVNGEIRSLINNESVLSDKNVCFPQIFSLSLQRNVEGYPGIKADGPNVNDFRYADHTVLIAENKEESQQFLDIVEKESRKKGLELNRKKTEVVSRDNECP